jgi:hypothetical protein
MKQTPDTEASSVDGSALHGRPFVKRVVSPEPLEQEERFVPAPGLAGSDDDKETPGVLMGEWVSAPDQTLVLDDAKIAEIDFFTSAPGGGLMDLGFLGGATEEMRFVPDIETRAKTVSHIPTFSTNRVEAGFKSAGPEEMARVNFAVATTAKDRQPRQGQPRSPRSSIDNLAAYTTAGARDSALGPRSPREGNRQRSPNAAVEPPRKSLRERRADHGKSLPPIDLTGVSPLTPRDLANRKEEKNPYLSLAIN